MTERNLAAAARHALVNLDNERELRCNPLVRGESLAYGNLRLIVLTALESFGSTGPATNKRDLRYAILVRCDLGGESHQSVIAAMEISRRQFYRERREALLCVGDSIERRVAAATSGRLPAVAVADFGDAGEAYVEALRAAGQYRDVWREASALAPHAERDSKAIEFWLVASEAARYFAEHSDAEEALRMARSWKCTDSYWHSLWLASSIGSLQWVAGNSSDARATVERVLKSGAEERTLHGKEAVLTAIALVSAAFMEVDCGLWERARSLLARASALAQNGTGAKHQSRLRLETILLRLSGDVALHADGDRARAIAAYRGALEIARVSGDLGAGAMNAVHLAVALDEADVQQALSLADYGLEIVRRFYPGDRLAEATVSLVPLLLRARGRDAAREAMAKARRHTLGIRDSLFMDFAEVAVATRSGDFEVSLERAEELSTKFRCHGIGAWACDAQLVFANWGSQRRWSRARSPAPRDIDVS